jgi:serine protease AprX
MRLAKHPLRVLSCSIALALAAAAAAQAAEVDSAVAAEAARAGSADTLIVLSAQSPKHLLRTDGDYLSRRRALVDMLRTTADTSQGELRRWLEAEGVEYRAYWIVNMVQARLTSAQINVLAARGDIARISSNAVVRSHLPQDEPAAPHAPRAVEWGVNKVKAPQLWTLGINGAGVVVAGQDTGIRWTHTALKAKYRGWDGVTADHNYNWHDAIHAANATCPADSPQPCDDHSHGSHTVGTILGDDGGANQVGVAPGAKWIGCRNMNAGNGTPATYNECAQWFLAPTDLAGLNPNPDKAPDVINNSWGCVPEEGCPGTGAEVRAAIENLVAGGIMFVASAGNDGGACSTIGSAPGTLDSVFTVGGTASNDTMYTSSSRGPVPVTPGTGVNNKPDVIAPGVTVRSVTRTNDSSYGNFTGTSMASPHVVGAAALLMQVNPSLKGNPAAVADILRTTAVPLTTTTQVCNGIPFTTFPNPVQGYGQIDVLAAFNKAEKIFADGLDTAP